MTQQIDITGQRFGKLVVVQPTIVRASNGNTVWACDCDCGHGTYVALNHLRKGNTRSCGCLQKERTIESHTTHGYGRGRKGQSNGTYRCWKGMISRCTNPNISAYIYYGARGISVCERWHKFENFLADMGEKPKGLTIERINNDGNYEPKNCKWATWEEQNNNKRKPRAQAILLTVEGL